MKKQQKESPTHETQPISTATPHYDTPIAFPTPMHPLPKYMP